MTPEQVKHEIAESHAEIAAAARREPEQVLLAILDELISVACGTNPHLRDTMRLQLYRRIRDRVLRIESQPSHEEATCTGCGKRATLARQEGGNPPWLCGDCERRREGPGPSQGGMVSRRDCGGG